MGMGRKITGHVLYMLEDSQVMWVLPRNACFGIRQEVRALCVLQTLLSPPAPGFVIQRSTVSAQLWWAPHMPVWWGCIMPLRADGHIKTPEDSHPSSTTALMGNIRASICLNGGTSLFPPSLGILLSTGGLKYSSLQDTPTSYTSCWACRAEGLISSRKVARQ